MSKIFVGVYRTKSQCCDFFESFCITIQFASFSGHSISSRRSNLGFQRPRTGCYEIFLVKLPPDASDTLRINERFAEKPNYGGIRT